MNGIIILVALTLISFSCKREMKFDVNKWNDFGDKVTYENRDAMLNDLLNKYPLKGQNINEMEKIFGKIDEHNFSSDENILIFTVLQKWNGIEPSYTKNLNIKYNQNGIIDDVYITEYEH